jgi:hypothetical protein
LYIGAIISGFAIIAIYYKNVKWTGYLPINSSAAFANDGTRYNISRVVVNNKLDEQLYQQYSPPFYSAGYLVTTATMFVFYPIYFIYIFFNQWRTIRKSFIDFYHGLRYGKSNYAGATDIHSRRMAEYKEVPDWWFMLILGITIILGFIFCHIFPLGVPEWTIMVPIAINLVFMVPLSILTA